MLSNTLVPHIMMADRTIEITFTVYSQNDLAYFALCINLQGQDVTYSNSYTYVAYGNGGTMQVTDQHSYNLNATVTVVQHDKKWPGKKTITASMEFVEMIV